MVPVGIPYEPALYWGYWAGGLCLQGKVVAGMMYAKELAEELSEVAGRSQGGPGCERDVDKKGGE